MGWGTTIGVVLLTALAGGCTAAGLAQFLIYYQQITSREGAAGYFAVFVIATGLIGGLVVGLVTAIFVRSGFWRAQGYALAAVVALTLLAAVLAIALDDHGPAIDGDKLVLELELKCPRGWQPDKAAKDEPGSFCWLQEQAVDAAREVNPMILGGLTLPTGPATDGQWVVTCAADLNKTRKGRFLRIFVGKVTEVTIQVPLPARPKSNHKQWSEWTKAGFLPQKDKPAAADYEFRCRVVGDTDYKLAHPDPTIAIREARQKALAAVPPDAPLSQWLPFFEESKGKPNHYSSDDAPERDAVRAKPAELIPLLNSSDRDTARQAVFAAVAIYKTPELLVEPLAKAGRSAIVLIKEAHAAGKAGNPDLAAEDIAYTYFQYWDMAMEQAGPAGAQQRRALLEVIARKVSAQPNSPSGGLHRIAGLAKKGMAEEK